MKEVEGHFGTAVVSYFIFLRFLFIMNLLIFALWFGFVVIPGIIDLRTSPNTVVCAYQPSETSDLLCPSDSNFTVVYPVEVPNQYYCNVSDDEDVFSVQLCSSEDQFSERKGNETLRVVYVQPEVG